MDEINIAIDVFPYKDDIWSICDYSGEQIYSKLAFPLFRIEKGIVELLAAESFHQTTNEIIINVKKNLFWSNGDRLNAKDYIRTIKHICSDKRNRYNKILASLVKNETAITLHNDHSFTLKTRWYDPFIIQYLSLINFSPMHESNDNVYAGPYVLIERNEIFFKLAKNDFFTLDNNKKQVSYINYILVDTDPDGNAFFTEKVHVSCNTAVDLKKYREFITHKNFVSCNEPLIMLLSPGNRFSETPLDVRVTLAVAIDRLTISARYDHMLKPIMSWMSMYFDGTYHELHADTVLRQDPFSIDVSYEDFYPNIEILNCIEEQLSPFRILLRKHEDKYGNWNSESHFRFEIRKAPEVNPIQLIRSDLSKTPKSEKTKNKINKLYSLLFTENLLDHQPKIFQAIDFHLRQQCLYIPLFVFPTGFFCNSFIVEKSLYTIGSRVFLKEGEWK